MDYKLNSKVRIFGHYIRNSNTFDVVYDSWISGLQPANRADRVCQSGLQLGHRQQQLSVARAGG
jgi:hypothetical protein